MIPCSLLVERQVCTYSMICAKTDEFKFEIPQMNIVMMVFLPEARNFKTTVVRQRRQRSPA